MILRVVLLALFCCAAAGWIRARRRARRYAAERAMAGIAPPGHPDNEAPLEEWELEALSRIEGGQG